MPRISFGDITNTIIYEIERMIQEEVQEDIQVQVHAAIIKLFKYIDTIRL